MPILFLSDLLVISYYVTVPLYSVSWIVATFLHCGKILKNMFVEVLVFDPSLFRIVKSGSFVGEFIFKSHFKRKKTVLSVLGKNFCIWTYTSGFFSFSVNCNCRQGLDLL